MILTFDLTTRHTSHEMIIENIAENLYTWGENIHTKKHRKSLKSNVGFTASTGTVYSILVLLFWPNVILQFISVHLWTPKYSILREIHPHLLPRSSENRKTWSHRPTTSQSSPFDFFPLALWKRTISSSSVALASTWDPSIWKVYKRFSAPYAYYSQ